MKKLKNQNFLSLSGIYFAIFGLLGLALILSAMSWKMLYKNSLSVNQSIYAAQLHLTQGHLGLQQKLHGKERMTLSQVLLQFKSAQKSTTKILVILKNFDQYALLKTANTKIPIASLLSINKKITLLKKETNQRWQTYTNKLITEKYAFQFDQHFEKIITDIMFVKHTLDKMVSHAMSRQLRLQLVTLFFWFCLLFATLSASIYLEKKRQQQEDKANILANFPKESPLPTLQFSACGDLLYSNEPGQRITKDWNQTNGIPEVWLKRINETLKKGEAQEYEYDHKDTSYFVKLSPSPVSNSVYFYAIDVTKRIQAIKKMEYLIYHDQLTDLPNRQQSENLLNQAIASSKRHNRKLALIILDINNFKSINDNLGRTKGDQLLKLIAERLESFLRKDKLIFKITDKTSISRVDGNKFAIILEDIKGSHDAGLVCQRILKDFENPFVIEKNEHNITVSAGVSIYPHTGQAGSHLFSFSEEALQKAKQAGRNSYQYYTKELHEQHINLLQLENDLSLALDKNQFSLVYQPQVMLANLTVVGAEVLIRWNHPDKGFISPDKFIPVAEHCGQIAAIGKWVIQHACQQWGDWSSQGIKLPKLAINLSSAQLHKTKFIDEINTIIIASGLKSEEIEFEITETSIMQDGMAVDGFLRDLKHAGYGLSIDDFGTGYSSLERLKKLPVELLKIDKSFIDDLSENSEDYFIVKTIISLAHSLNLLVLAEGVETQEQLNILKQLNCDIVQGYLFSKPLSPVDFLEFLNRKISAP
ncbi:MAG: bifunctional diguanylate cyclase/phosphodiesterase [Legionellaceae bacterium]|nr:bifunctional diguanylate cyclase/phosphodiesterase [Legionellaceae bacterium]